MLAGTSVLELRRMFMPSFKQPCCCNNTSSMTSSDRMPSQHEHDQPKAKRKRTESRAGGKESEKSSQQKQNDEFFYKLLHESHKIQIATVEASDLLRAFRQWPNHLQLSIPMHVSSTILQLSTSNDPELVELVGRYWQASLMTSVRLTMLTLPGP